MRNCAIRCVVILAAVGAGCSKEPEPQEQGVATPEVAAGSETEGPPKELTVELGGGVTMQFVLIPAGEFMMGSRETPEELAKAFEPYRKPSAEVFKDERPLHRVRITKPFYLGKYEVTVGQFRQFVAQSGYKTDAEKPGEEGAYAIDPAKGALRFSKDFSWRNVGFPQSDEHPVVLVSWKDSVEFCKWLGGKQGKTYRLPTEAEWEYACRAGTTTRYHSGDDPESLAQVGNVADAALNTRFPGATAIKANDGYVFTAPVGRFKPNAFGLYDMHGNACEWCADWYGEDYYGKSPVEDPGGPSSGAFRVLRGGSWGAWVEGTRSGYRYRSTPDFRDSYFGFRVARTAY